MSLLTDPIARLALGVFISSTGAVLLLAGIGMFGAVCCVVGLLLLASQKRNRKPSKEDA